jgi:hypothetical protein
MLAVLLATTAVAATSVTAAEMRTWNFNSGATMEAEIVAFPGPETVEVKRSDGKVYTLPTAYLSSADRAYLDAERAKQWKQVSVDKLLGTASAGRYKKCAVSGKDVGGEILVALLPSQVEAILNNRQQQEGQITDLNSRIQADSSVAQNANAAAATAGSRAYRNANRSQAKLATQDETAAKASLNKLKADLAEYVKKTKAATTVLMKKTGLVYEGLPVWECKTSQNHQENSLPRR